jgi:CheY-like chemotaxis protein
MSGIPEVLINWNVLVVEDEEDSRVVAMIMLEMAGANVTAVENGVEALKAIRFELPDFILSDLSMPQMDGWQLINELKQNRDTFEIPVIALTAHAMPGDRERAITAGFVNHLTKPLDPDKFFHQLLGLLVEIPQFEGRIA